MNNSRKILITGESGFIGSHFIISLTKKYPEYELHGLDNLTYASNRLYTKKLELYDNYQFHKIDICNRDEIKTLFKKYQFTDVIHLAAESHVDNSIHNPGIFVQTNIVGTLNLLDAFKAYSSGRFHHISTDEVYGDLNMNDELFTEQSPYKPSSPYSASKASANHLVKSFGITFNIPITILNFCNNYGPYQFPEKFIPTVIINALKKKVIPIYGNGKNIREWIFVEDCCKAIESTFSKVKFGNEYNIGSGYRTDNLTIAKMICKLLGKVEKYDFKKLIRYVKDRPGHDFRYAIDSSKIQNELGWKPKESFNSGIEKTIKWYIENESWWNNIQKKRYNQERLGRIL